MKNKLKRIQIISSKNQNFFYFWTLVTVIIFGVAELIILGLFFTFQPASIERRNFGFGAKQYFTNRDHWNLSYIDDAQIVEFISFVNQEKESKKGQAMYQLNVYGFADGNEDGIGDLWGAKNHLNYLDNLGVSIIWLSPIHISPSYHGYDVMDYTSVAPEYGGMAAFNSFLKEAHNRGIKIYLDTVFNHTSAKHPWMAEAIMNPDSKYRNYYKFGQGQLARNAGYDSDDQFYSAFNWHGMPDLNLSNPDVLTELNAVLKFWVKKGVDGFRFDAFKHFFDEGRDANIISGTNEVFYRFKKAVNDAAIEIGRPINDVQFMGEGLGLSFATIKSMTNYEIDNVNYPALDGAYDPQFWSGKMPFITSSNVNEINQRAKDLKTAGGKVSGRRMVSWIPYLENHDSWRWMQVMRRNNLVENEAPLSEDDKAYAKSAYATLIFAPGRPIIYQGGELGYHAVKRSDPFVREPLTWKGETEIKFYDYNIYDPNYRLNIDNDPIQLTESRDVGTATANKNDKNSIYNHIKSYLNIEAEYSWLKNPENKVYPLSTIPNLNLDDGGIRKNTTTNEEIIWLCSDIHNIYQDKTIKVNTYNLSSYVGNRTWKILHASTGASATDLSSIVIPRTGCLVFGLS